MPISKCSLTDVKVAVAKFSIEESKNKQKDSTESVVRGHRRSFCEWQLSVVALPTGCTMYGKSLCYQVLPIQF